MRTRATPTSLPDDFSLSDRVKTWAAEKGHTRLDEHLEAFKGKAQAKGYTYADWDAALMNAIRDDWAKLGTTTALARQVRSGPMSDAQREAANAAETEEAMRMLRARQAGGDTHDVNTGNRPRSGRLSGARRDFTDVDYREDIDDDGKILLP